MPPATGEAASASLSLLGIPLTRTAIQVALRDALLALAGGAVLALSLASLSAAGIITMGAAILELAGAFVVGAFVALVSPISSLAKMAVIGALGVSLFALGWYEDAHFVPPITRSDIKQAVQDGSLAHPYDSPGKCPEGWTTVSRGNFSGAKKANVSIPKEAHICFYDLSLHDSGGPNFEVRDGN